MIRWNQPPIDRHQIALFAPTLDAFLSSDHTVRFLAELLAELDFSAWEACYDGLVGQPPIHPRVLAGVILYGLTLRIRSSRRLEDACANRLDFIWLAEGRTIDHSTLCKFRTRHRQQLKDLFRQVVLIADGMGLVQLNQLIWDGTRIKANNGRHHTARQPKLEELVRELDQQFEQMLQEAEQQDEKEASLYGEEAGSGRSLPAKLAQAERRLKRMKAALRQVRQMQEESEGKRATTAKAPAAAAEGEAAAAEAGEAKAAAKGPQVPLADPEARVLPNKEGGYAPNYTPVVAVDAQSLVVVDGEVVPGREEEQAIVPSLQRIEQTLGRLPQQALADSGFHTGETLAALEEKQVEALIPAKVIFKQNPALRADPTSPVPPEQWGQLPVNPSSKHLDKACFIYAAAKDCYWCPMGQAMSFAKEQNYQQGRHYRQYRVYRCAGCGDCLLRERCFKGTGQVRQIYREKYDAVRERAADRLKTPEGEAAYRRRMPGEGVFGIVKAVMGVRQFLLRGMEKVKLEWDWVLTAYDLRLLMKKRRALALGR